MANQQLEVGQQTVQRDLAQALEGQSGTFICQQGGQSYLAIAKPGHSITSLKAVGKRFIEVPTIGAQEAWTVEKISNQELFGGSLGESGEMGQSYRTNQGGPQAPSNR